MRIGIIAPEESGKTSYLVGLYGTLVHIKNRDISHKLVYEFSDNRQRGYFEDRFGDLIQPELGADRFPKKTRKIQYYKVRARSKDSHVWHDVELIDFPGGLLRGDQSDKDDDDDDTPSASDVDRVLTKCHAFIVLLDAKYLTGKGSATSAYKTAADQIAKTLKDAFSKMKNDPLTLQGIPVAFCVSKFDRVKMTQKEDMDGAYSRVVSLFPEFFHMDHTHPVLISGVTLGDDIEQGGEFAPFQLEAPLEFCLAMCAFNARRRNYDQADNSREAQEKLSQKVKRRENMGLLDLLIDYVETGFESTDYYRSQEAAKEASHERFRDTMSEFRQFGFEATKSVKESYIDKCSSLYYKGARHKFKDNVDNWSFPLEEA